MIRSKLLIATAITASVAITACSDITAPKKLVPGGLPAAALLAPHAVAGLAATVVGTINGGGTAEMQAPFAAGSSVFGMVVKLLSDGSATGEVDCVDQHGDNPGFPGNIWGQVTSWSGDLNGTIVLNIIGKFHPIPGGPGHLLVRDLPFTVTIQQFGGAGVGRWTLAVPDGSGGWITVCYEILTSGQIVIRLA